MTTYDVADLQDNQVADPTAFKLREWTWPPTPWYNGFSSAERIRGWQIQWLLIHCGLRPGFRPEKTCTICSNSHSRVGLHSENYYAPWEFIWICQSCHGKLHKRYAQPEPWLKLMDTYYDHPPAKWATDLNMNPAYDLAGHERAEHGPEIRDYAALDKVLPGWPADQMAAMETPRLYNRLRQQYLAHGVEEMPVQPIKHRRYRKGNRRADVQD